MFAVIGGLSLLAHYYTLNGIKSRTVGDGQHGTARFATKKEIQRTYKRIPFRPKSWRKNNELPQEQGIILGSIGKKNEVTALVDTDDVHTLMINGLVSTDPKVKAYWQSIPCEGEVPTPEEFIAYTADVVRKQKRKK